MNACIILFADVHESLESKYISFFSPRLPRVRLVQPGRPISIGILWRWKHINTRCGSFWWLAVFNLTRTFQVQNQPPQATPCDALCFEDHHPTVDVYTNDTMAELWNFIRTWYFRMIWLRNKVRRWWKKASTALRIIINIRFVLVCGIVMCFRSRLSNETISRYLSATKRPSSQGQHSKTSRPVEEPEILRVFGDNHFLLIVVAASHSTPSSDPKENYQSADFCRNWRSRGAGVGPRKGMKNRDWNHVRSFWGFPKIMVPPKSSILIGFFHYKPSILGYPYFWKPPYNDIFVEVIDCSCETLKQITDIICFARHHSSLSSKISLWYVHMYTYIKISEMKPEIDWGTCCLFDA